MLARHPSAGFSGRSDSVSRYSINLTNVPTGVFFGDGSFQMTISTVKRASLYEQNTVRHALHADSRGRLVVGEGREVVFCNGLAIANQSEPSPQSRSSLCIYSSVKIPFDIIGVRLSSENECLLAVWGFHDVTVLQMSSCSNVCKKRVELIVDLQNAVYSSNSILRCQWLSGSSRWIAICSQRAVLVYDLTVSASKPAVTFRLPTEVDTDVDVVDFAAVSLAADCELHKNTWKIFILLSNGTLHEFCLGYGDGNELFAPKTLLFPGQGMHIPFSQALGRQDCCQLMFLEQSRLLIYHVKAGDVFCIPVGLDGEIKNASLLVPSTL